MMMIAIIIVQGNNNANKSHETIDPIKMQLNVISRLLLRS